MWKINKERLAFGLKVGIILFGLLFGIFFVFFGIPLSVIENEKILHIYIPSVILVILLPVLVILYYSCLAYKNNKPKYIDGKYVWKDGRVYEGDWDKKCGANGKGKLTWSDGSYYEGEFKNGHLSGKGKKVCPSGESYEGDREKDEANGMGKSLFLDGSSYEGEFKDGKPHGKGVMKMKNGYYYEGEFNNGKIAGRFRKQIISSGGSMEGEFRKNGNNGYDGTGKVITSNGFTFEGVFKDGKLSGEGKATFPDGSICIGNYVNGELNGLARCYFKDGSYYEGECKQGNWYGVGTYVTKKGDKYSTEFPYEIINIFMYGLKSKMKEIQGKLNYIPMDEKEKQEEKNKNLEISEKGTLVQKEIVKLSLNGQEKLEILLDSLKADNSLGNNLEVHKNMLKFYEEHRKKNREIANKNHIKSSKSASSNSYGKYFYELDCIYGIIIEIVKFYIKFDKFLDSKNILDFVIKREEKNRERVILIDEFSEKYKEYIQSCLDWREYEKKFWEDNFKPDKNDN